MIREESLFLPSSLGATGKNREEDKLSIKNNALDGEERPGRRGRKSFLPTGPFLPHFSSRKIKIV